jgi:phytoene/squalene synthetase
MKPPADTFSLSQEEAPVGSSLYYSLLYTDNPLRQKILDIRHMAKKLAMIQPIACEWWQNFLEKHYPLLLPTLAAFLKNRETSLYEEDASLHHFYQQTAGLIEKQVGICCGIKDDVVADILETLGIFIARASHLSELRKHIFDGKIHFSGEALIKHQVTLYHFSQLTLTPEIKNLLSEETALLKKMFLTSTETLSKSAKKLIRPSLILGHIYYQLLLEIERADFPVLTHQIGLTPLRKWWIAWRC